MYDGTQYKVYDENGKPTTTTIASGEKNPSGSVPFALGLGNGTWFTSSGKGFTGNDIVSDVTKSPIYNNDLQTFAFGADGKAHNWDKPAS
jgi:hypothetical protein